MEYLAGGPYPPRISVRFASNGSDSYPMDGSDESVEPFSTQTRTGVPWRDLPGEFGDWNVVYQRFRRWEKRDVWKQAPYLVWG